MKENRNKLKSYFETGDQPTSAEFKNVFDSTLNLSGSNGITGSLTISGSTSNNADGSAVMLHVMGDITASGNISASGTIYADNFESTGGDVAGISFTDDLNITGDITASGNISASGTIYADKIIVSEITASQITASITILTQNFTSSGNAYFKGNITASGQISSSGTGTNVFGGAISLISSTAANQKIRFGDGTQQIQGGDHYLIIEGDDTVHLRADTKIHMSSSEVGIGPAFSDSGNSPSANFHISGSGASKKTLIVEGHDGTDYLTVGVGGHITASGNISASGTIQGLSGSFSHILGNSPITVQDQTTFQSPITASGTISASGNILANQIGTNKIDATSALLVGAESPYTLELKSNDLYHNGASIRTLGHITASGDISSSGIITATTMSVGGNYANGRAPIQFRGDVRIFDNHELRIGTGPSGGESTDLKIHHDGTDSNIHNSVGDLNIQQTSGDITIKNFGTDDGINLLLDNNPINPLVSSTGTVLISGSANPGIRLDVRGDITASGDISSSGNIIGTGFIGNGRIFPDFNLSANHYLDKTTVTNPILRAVGGFNVVGHVTASGDISGSIIEGQTLIADVYLSAPSASIINLTNTNITSSGNISSSGDIKGLTITTPGNITGSTIEGQIFTTDVFLSAPSASIINLTNTNITSSGNISGSTLSAEGFEANSGTLHCKDGGTQTQGSNKQTGVTLSTHSGQITMNAEELASAAETTFIVTNTNVSALDVVVACHGSAGTTGAYTVEAHTMGSGVFSITVSNVSGGALDEAIVINFVVLKGASS